MKIKLVLLFLFSLISEVVAAEIDVLVTTRNIKRGEIITQDDIKMEKIVSKNNSQYLCDINLDRYPVKYTKNLETGKAIKKSDIYVDMALIHKGETVSAHLIKKNLIIEFVAIALSDGVLNENIRVKSIDTNKILTGKVMEDKTILISAR